MMLGTINNINESSLTSKLCSKDIQLVAARTEFHNLVYQCSVAVRSKFMIFRDFIVLWVKLLTSLMPSLLISALTFLPAPPHSLVF